MSHTQTKCTWKKGALRKAPRGWKSDQLGSKLHRKTCHQGAQGLSKVEQKQGEMEKAQKGREKQPSHKEPTRGMANTKDKSHEETRRGPTRCDQPEESHQRANQRRVNIMPAKETHYG
jgi:hypothetical protein